MFLDPFSQHAALNQVAVPDLWQQEAISALRAGKDVVVHAPTGSGKTLIFEVWSNQGKLRGQAIYTVPTRALANDKLAEWRARGWDVGIATGDLAENLRAPVLVATLETQKHRLMAGEGPSLLVVDEYQMLGDQDRGLNYELALALAPPRTQLLLLSGSVANPQDPVKWLQRLGRDAVLVRHDLRPVPLDEVHVDHLNFHLPSEIRGYWPRFAARALADDLGPILIFAPRRQGAESLASELSRQLPTPNPLQLTPEQKQLAGEDLGKMLKNRIAYHHSGLSYTIRAGLIEPLAKAGQLRVVVATMGLAAGINFSLRSVALAGESYRRDFAEQPLRPDEILQMFGRAGRRGIDETGYVLISSNKLNLRDGYPAHLARSGMVDWGALLGVMAAASDQGADPFAAAVKVQSRLFTTKPIFLGVEQAMRHPQTPCGLKTDSERARHVRKRVPEMLNSRGEWERTPPAADRPLKDVFLHPPLAPEALNLLKLATPGEVQPLPLIPALSAPEVLAKTGSGTLCPVGDHDGRPVFGRAVTVAERPRQDQILLVKWIRRLTQWNGRHATADSWRNQIVPLIERKFAELKTPVLRFEESHGKILSVVSLAELPVRAHVDRHGVGLWHPPERHVLPDSCAGCDRVPDCRLLPTATGVALLWRRLGLVDASGAPTLKGRLVSFFTQGVGLAIAAALDDENYPIDELVYDIANLDAGFRFCGDENRWGGRLANTCHQAYGLQTLAGYLENGLPPQYGAGAEAVVAAVHKNPLNKSAWISDLLGAGDIDRIIIEWRSLLRRISHSPPLEWPRWNTFQTLAKAILAETDSPTCTELPALPYDQTRRIDHRLILRRH